MIPTLMVMTVLAAPVAQDPAPQGPDPTVRLDTIAPPEEAPAVGASLTYLRGFRWRTGPASRDVFTVETHARSRWTELFVMTEARHLTTRPVGDDGGGTFAYVEGHLRWRLGRAVGFPSVVLAHELNTGGGRLAHLHGVGWVGSLGTGAMRIHAYVRDDVGAAGVTPQVLVAGATRARVAGLPLRLAGYGDFVGSEGELDGLFYGEFQVLVETGLAGGAAVGVELHHSRSLGGGARPEEWVPQVAVQWTF